MNKAVLIPLFIFNSFLFSLWALSAAQGNGYRYRRGAVFQNVERFCIYILLTVLGGFCVVLTVFSRMAGMSAAAFILFAGVIYGAVSYGKKRTKFKFTPRGIRLCAAVFALLCGGHIPCGLFLKEIHTALTAHFALFIGAEWAVYGINAVFLPFEKRNNLRYIRDAKLKLEGLNAVKIGITGSFGKTGCKNILAAMLSRKYKVLKTAESYNTPMGICKTVRALRGDEEIFIAEMGARRKGDIRELCDIVKPSYALITGTGNQHLATFKTEENLWNTKKELIDSLPPHGYAVFNGDNAGSLKMSGFCPCQCQTVHTAEKTGVYAADVRLNNAGSSFTVHGLGEPFAVTTKLLGRHNILNILLCAALAARLGVSNEDIAAAAGEIPPVPHRLALVENVRGITVIDDSYNQNTEGAAFALEVIRQFEGRKVVFTQGVVELGRAQYAANQTLGVLLSQAADAVLLLGENLSALRSGLEKGGFQGEIHLFKTFSEAQAALSDILRAGDVFLIQNDIP